MVRSSKANKRIRKGDKVIITSGNDKGLEGQVLSRRGDYALVQGVNKRKKHVKPSEANPKGGVIEFEKPIHFSNLRLIADEKPVRLRVRESEEGKEYFYRSKDQTDHKYRLVKKVENK